MFRIVVTTFGAQLHVMHVHEVRVLAARHRAAPVMAAHHLAPSPRRNRLTGSVLRLARCRLVRPRGWVRRRGRLDAAAWIDAADVLRIARGLLSHHLIY